MDIDEMTNAAMGFAMYDSYRKVMDKYSIANNPVSDSPVKNYYAILNGVQSGPYTSGEIASMIARGNIPVGTYMWKEGMDDWLPVEKIPEFMDSVKSINGKEV